MRQRTRGVKLGRNDGPRGWDCPMKVSVHFINVCPLKKPNFPHLWCAFLPSWSHFEHSGTKMGCPDNEALYWTLCLSIISTCSTSKFHLKMSQCSAWGVVMPVANLTPRTVCPTFFVAAGRGILGAREQRMTPRWFRAMASCLCDHYAGSRFTKLTPRTPRKFQTFSSWKSHRKRG